MLTSMEEHLVWIDSTWQYNLNDMHHTSEKARRGINRNREGKSVSLKCQLTSLGKLSQGQN